LAAADHLQMELIHLQVHLLQQVAERVQQILQRLAKLEDRAGAAATLGVALEHRVKAQKVEIILGQVIIRAGAEARELRAAMRLRGVLEAREEMVRTLTQLGQLQPQLDQLGIMLVVAEVEAQSQMEQMV
jgi:hypothetical protein